MEWHENRSRNKVIKQMLEGGESVSHIAKLLDCNKSTVHYYTKKIGINHSEEVKSRITANACAVSVIAAKAYKKNWTSKRKKIIDAATDQWKHTKTQPDLMAFLGLYWGEGSKRNGTVGVVNNDPGVIQFCYDIISKFTDKPIEVVVRYYPEQDPQTCKAYWEKLLGRDIKIKKKTWLGKKRRTWSEFGICNLRLSDWKLYLKIITWIALWRAEITGTKATIDPEKSIARSGLFSTIEYS